MDRVLPLIVDLRRFLFHLYRLLETIPLALFHTARTLSAPSGHLPHAGKALSVVIVFPHMRVYVLTMREKRHPRIVISSESEKSFSFAVKQKIWG